MRIMNFDSPDFLTFRGTCTIRSGTMWSTLGLGEIVEIHYKHAMGSEKVGEAVVRGIVVGERAQILNIHAINHHELPYATPRGAAVLQLRGMLRTRYPDGLAVNATAIYLENVP